MLSQNEQAAFDQSSANVRARAFHHLRVVRDVFAAVGFVSNLHHALDKAGMEVNERGPAMECKAGCSHCCSVRVEATDAEIYRIAREVGKRPADQADRLLGRLEDRVSAGDYGIESPRRSPCAFLEKDLCSIYAVRPAVCRKAHSLSVRSCLDSAREIPQNMEMLLVADALIQGISGAYREAALPSSAHELCKSVLAVLRDPGLEARWYSGESVLPV